MTLPSTYLPGVPCWVETLHPDPESVLAFYGALFGWSASGPGPMPDGGSYFVAQLRGADVAGIATLPPDGRAEPAWTTYVSVDDLDAYLARATAAGGRTLVPPLDAPPAGRLAIVEAPGGSTFGMWEPQSRRGAERINEAGAWAMSALRTRDIAAATPFYSSVFGWNVEPFDAGGAAGALLRLPGYVGGLPQQPVPRDVVAVALADDRAATDHWSVDFWIDDVDAAVGRVAQGGGTVLAGPFDVATFRRAVVACPAGAIFSISQLMPERLRAAPSRAAESTHANGA